MSEDEHFLWMVSTYLKQQKCPSDRSCRWSRLCSGPWWWRPEIRAQEKKKASRVTSNSFIFLGSLKFLVGHLYIWTLFSIYNALPSPLPLDLVWHPGHALQFICSLITDDKVWMSGHHCPSYQHTASLTAVKPASGQTDRCAYCHNEQCK